MTAKYLRRFICAAAACSLFCYGEVYGQTPVTTHAVEQTETLIGLHFTETQRDSLLGDVRDMRSSYDRIRAVGVQNNVPPAILFNPLPVGWSFETTRKPFRQSAAGAVRVPKNSDECAHYSIGQLAALLKTRAITSVQLTQFYLARLKKYGPKLECVITLTEDKAMEQARRADAEIAAGKYRGPLHGIPYGVKDLLSTKGIRTTWGSVPFKEQMIDEDATVIKRLEQAGAVLVAKTTMGELAWGDVWFGGKTRNPWNYAQGSSGSSAGSASATSAGLIAFGIGTETYGSIVSPSTVCGTTGLRPTYGRVSRTGAMALSWSMDKIGAICRTVEDCALVFNAIYGPDGIDQTLYDAPFNYAPSIDLKKLRIGYLKADFDSVKNADERANNEASFAVLRKLGATLIPVELPKFPVNDLTIILNAEAAAAFDDLTRSGRDSLMVRQIKNAWPNSFRSSRFIPAVEYLQANRVRFLLIQEMAKLMKHVDVIVAPPNEGDNSIVTNLTGHPCVVLPNGFVKAGTPTSITFLGKLFDEATLLAVAKKYQDVTAYHTLHPQLHE
jgi:Asp-tRNA(Asn)/Glu-tRNA(Gln) amidotransferase A subunit family amidase